jgi:hypothetical protein
MLCAATLSAQEFRGTILGRVSDPTGAVIPGAKVTITNQETNVPVNVETNGEGNYVAPYMIPGTYRVVVTSAGFKKWVREGVIVQINARMAIDATLEIGAVSDAVTVTAESPLLQTSDADLGQVVNRDFLDNLPISGRSVLDLADMAPGVRAAGGGFPGVTGNDQAKMAINGGNGTERGADLSVDGVAALAPRQAGLAVGIPMADAVQQFKVNTTMFDASQGRSNGGAVSLTTKSGTNDYHGTAYYYTQRSALNANSWTNNRAGIAKPALNLYAAGVTVGGPVRLPKYDGHNRTFFFFGFEKDKNGRSAPSLARVPSDAEKQGDFSKTLAPTGVPLAIYDPMTTSAASPSNSRTAFPGAIIPAARLSPIGVAVMNTEPKPNQNVATQIGVPNWASAMNFTTYVKNWQSRIDQQIGSKQRFFARVAVLNHIASPDPAYFVGAYNVPPNGTSNLNTDSRRQKSVSLDDTIVFSPTLIGSLRAGYTRLYTYNFMEGDKQDPAALKLPEAITGHQLAPAWPIFDLSAETMPFIGSRPRQSVNDVWTLLGNFSKSHGNHGLRWGVDSRIVRWNENNPGTYANGEFRFNNTLTRSNPATSSTGNTSGTAMASLLLGMPSSASGSRLGYTSPLTLQNIYTGFFFQDDWKVSRRLTLNLGLRYEMEAPSTERFDRLLYSFDPTLDLGLTAPGLGPLKGGVRFVNDQDTGRHQGKVDKNNFGPRFGFAFVPRNNLVIRGGYGIFYSSGITNLSSGTPTTDGAFGALTQYVGSSGGTDYVPIPGVNLSNPFPNGYVQPTGKSLGTKTDLGSNVTYLDPNRVLPYVQQWQLSVQRQFRGQVLGEIAYVGMHSLRLYEDLSLNQTPDYALSLNSNVNNPFLGLLPATSTLGTGSTLRQRQLLVLYPHFNAVNQQRHSAGRVLYHALQARAQKRMSHGLQLVGNYTFSKALQYQQTTEINVRHNNRTVTAIDRTHMFRLFTTYELPFGRNRALGRNWPRPLDLVLGGWSLTWVSRFTTGDPLAITDTNGIPIPVANPVTSGSTRDRLGDRMDPATKRPSNPYIDPNAFIHIADFRVSPEPALWSWLRGPTAFTNNATLVKIVGVTERFKVELRAEIAGPFNHPVFENPPDSSLNLATPATFGQITSAGGARSIMFGAKLRF